MAITLSDATRNRLRDGYVAAFPAGATLTIRTGSSPGANAAATGTVLATITLPATPWTSTTGVATKNGTWSATATGIGTAGYYRLNNSTDTEDGAIGTDLVLDNSSISTGQTVTISTFVRTMPG
jgi:hypothetical protein